MLNAFRHLIGIHSRELLDSARILYRVLNAFRHLIGIHLPLFFKFEAAGMCSTPSGI